MELLISDILSCSQKADNHYQTGLNRLLNGAVYPVSCFDKWIPVHSYATGIQVETGLRPILKDYTGKSGFICRMAFTNPFLD